MKEEKEQKKRILLVPTKERQLPVSMYVGFSVCMFVSSQKEGRICLSSAFISWGGRPMTE